MIPNCFVANVSSSALFGCKIKNLIQIASVSGLNLKLSKVLKSVKNCYQLLIIQIYKNLIL